MTNPLASAVSSLRSSNALLSSSISILDSGVNDFPRLSKVLQTTRHFDLLPSSHLHTAQLHLLSSLTPELDLLFQKIEAQIARLERREQALIARCELLEGRIGDVSSEREKGEEGWTEEEEDEEVVVGDGRVKGDGRDGRGEEDRRERMRVLGGRRERLAYAVERLNLQAQQRQRQLRLSVAGR